MTTWVVSRHPGAVAWLQRRGFKNYHQVAHLDPAGPQPGDVVVGNVPIPLIAALTERGVAYYHLIVPVTLEWRGAELSCEELNRLGARLERFEVRRLSI